MVKPLFSPSKLIQDGTYSHNNDMIWQNTILDSNAEYQCNNIFIAVQEYIVSCVLYTICITTKKFSCLSKRLVDTMSSSKSGYTWKQIPWKVN